MKLGNIVTASHSPEEEMIDIYPDVGEITDQEENDVDEVLETLYQDSHELEDAGEGLDLAIIEYKDFSNVEDALKTEIAKHPEKMISPVTMQSLRTTMHLIARNNGLDVGRQAVVTLQSYDKGNITESNRITLAGVGGAIKALWEKIKSALKALWKSIKKFWQKHISSLGVMKKKIKKLAKKVTKVKGSIDYSSEINLKSSLNKCMAFKGDITVKNVINLIKLHVEETKKSIKFSGKAAEQMQEIAKSSDTRQDKDLNFDKVGDDEAGKDRPIELGSEKDPLATGFYGYVEIDEKGDDDTPPTYKFTKESTSDYEDDNRKVVNDGKRQLLALLQELRDLHETTVDLGKDFDKQNDKFDKASNDIEHVVRNSKEETEANKVRASSEDEAESSAAMHDEDENEKGADKSDKTKQLTIAFRSVASTLPAVNSKMSSLNLKLMKETLTYVKLCIKNYSRVGD